MYRSFGDFLHEVRSRQNGSSLARSAGISYVYLLDIEKGARSVPSKRVIKALAENLQFEEGEKEMFFDLAARDAADLPVDLVEFLRDNEKVQKMLRRIQESNKIEHYLHILEDAIQHENEEN